MTSPSTPRTEPLEPVSNLLKYCLGPVPETLKVEDEGIPRLNGTIGICSNLLENVDLVTQTVEVIVALVSPDDSALANVNVYLGENDEYGQNYHIHSYTDGHPSNLYYWILTFDGPNLPETKIRLISEDAHNEVQPRMDGKRKAKSVTVSSLDGGGH